MSSQSSQIDYTHENINIQSFRRNLINIEIPRNPFIPTSVEARNALRRRYKNAEIKEKFLKEIYNPTTRRWIRDNPRNRARLTTKRPKTRKTKLIKAVAPKINYLEDTPQNRRKLQKKYRGMNIKTKQQRGEILNPFTGNRIIDNARNRRLIQSKYNYNIMGEIVRDLRRIRERNIEQAGRNERRPIRMRINRGRNIKRIIQTIDIMRTNGEINENIYMTFNGRGYTLTRDRMEQIINNFDRFLEDATVEVDHEIVSDREFFATIVNENIEEIEIEFITNGTRVIGGFFKYTHKLDFDLSRYGIYQEVDAENYNYNCLIDACKNSGKMDENQLFKLKEITHNGFIPQSKLKEVSNILDIGFTIKRVRNHNEEGRKSVEVKINTHFDNIINLGLVDEHYFLIEPVNITSYAIENYEEIKYKDRWNLIYKKNGNKFKRDEKRIIDSYRLVKLLVENSDKLLKRIDLSNEIMKTPYYHKIPDITNLDYDIKSDIKPIKFKGKSFKDGQPLIIHSDFETTTDGDIHKPYLVGYKVDEEDKTYSIFNINPNKVVEKFLWSIYWELKNRNIKSKTALIYFHNLGYDIRFIISYLKNHNIIQKSETKIINLVGNFAGMKFIFNCTYAMTNTALGKFNESFKLGEQNKEVYPYGIYTDENIRKYSIKIDDAITVLINEGKTSEDIEEFKNNLKDLNIIVNGNEFKHIDYAIYYCKEDVKTQMKGFNKMRDNIFKICEDYENETGKIVEKLDIHNYLTLASLVDDLLKNFGCYEGCNEISGIPRAFIQNCVVGGRCMTKNNKKIKVIQEIKFNEDYLNNKMKIYKEKGGNYIIDKDINGKDVYIYYLENNGSLSDFDAVSLYPSAMNREEFGFLRGIPKVLRGEELNYDFLKKQSGYFVKINITKINKKYSFPLISKKNDNGIRVFSNDLLGIHYIDNYGLEDLIKFQNIEFEVLQGYYFNEGHNTLIRSVMKFLFTKRLEMKKIGNPIQAVYKLLMNSAYGKTCLKEITDEIKIMDINIFKKEYLPNNFNSIKYTVELPNNLIKVKSIKPINKHFNACHIGSNILSMSKRIMNEVMTLAEDNDINIFYQDTDSMHIETDKIALLSNEYFNLYNRELIGKNMGQFHSDFEMGQDKGNEPVAIESNFLGKKCYLDKVKFIKDGKEEIGYHKRLKGIPHKTIDKVINDKSTKSLDDKIKENTIKFNGNAMKLYDNLLYGNAVNFNLLDGGVKFEADKNYEIKNKEIFDRTVKF